jgi:hypothetical protein
MYGQQWCQEFHKACPTGPYEQAGGTQECHCCASWLAIFYNSFLALEMNLHSYTVLEDKINQIQFSKMFIPT